MTIAGFALKSSRPFLLPVLLAVIPLLLVACGKRSAIESQQRAVTSEIVAAAEKTSNRKATVSVHSEIPSFHGIPLFSEPSIDDVDVSLSDASQAFALTRAIADIAHRHKMSISETSSAGTNRFDFAFRGAHTHTIRVVMPLRARIHPVPEHAGNPLLAIIIDDLGNDRAAGDAVIALPFSVTVSVMPHLPFSGSLAEKAFRRGDEVLLHLPMEAESVGAKAEPDELRVGMNAEDVPAVLAAMLTTVPHAVGVNNHEGSRATSDPDLMNALMLALRNRRLFFVDSRTTAATVAYDAAERFGVPAASRKVFLDDEDNRPAIQAQLELAANDAMRDGTAIAIGHPRAATIATLAQGVPPIQARGVRLVFASDLVH